MKGYRCDSCFDFHPEVAAENAPVWSSGRKMPETWITLGPGQDQELLHFCSPGCVAAYVQRRFFSADKLHAPR